MGLSQTITHLKNKRDLWLSQSKRWTFTYYSLGVLSVLFSGLAASDLVEEANRHLSGLAAILVAIIGFVNPEKKRARCLRAYLILDSAILRFEDDLISVDHLHNERDRAEAALHNEEGLQMERLPQEG